MPTKLKTAIIHDGERLVHATGHNGSYATLCGLDGGDQHPDVQQSTDALMPGEKISCRDCRAIWEYCKQYRRRDFNAD